MTRVVDQFQIAYMRKARVNPFCPKVFIAPPPSLKEKSENQKIQEEWMNYWSMNVDMVQRCEKCSVKPELSEEDRRWLKIKVKDMNETSKDIATLFLKSARKLIKSRMEP